MGRTVAYGLFMNLPLTVALEHHLRYNHYPPLPKSLAPVAESAIDAVNEGDSGREIELPKGIEVNKSTTLTAGKIIDWLHLDSMVEQEYYF